GASVRLLVLTRSSGSGAGVNELATLHVGWVSQSANERVACVISGGNIYMSLVGRSIDFGLSASGRLLSIVVTLPDRPGNLAGLINEVAGLGMNVRDVRHRRGELNVPVGLTAITLELETRDRQHQRQLIEKLRQRGHEVTVLAPDA